MDVLRHYLLRFWQYARYRAVLLFLLGILASSLRGVGFLLILPFLQILGITETGAGLPGFVQTLIEYWRTSPLPFELSTVLIGYVLLVSSVALLTFWEKLWQARLANGFVEQLQTGLYDRIIHAPWTYLARIKRGELLQNIQTDVNHGHNAVNECLTAVSSTVICGVYLFVSLQMSVSLTVVSIAVGLGIAALMLPLQRRIEKAAGRGRTARVEILRHVEERVSMIKLVKSFANETAESQAFAQDAANQRQNAVTAFTAMTLVPLSYSIMGAVALSLVVWVAVGSLSVGPERVLILILVFSRLVPQVSRIQTSMNRIAGQMPGLKSLRTREQELTAHAEPSPSKKPVPLPLHQEIRFQDVSFTYPGKSDPAVAHLELTIPAHQITALAGPSGSGKSTVADLTLSLLRPGQGSVTIDGTTLNDEYIARWRHSTAYMPQEQLFLHDTIRANLKWAKPEATEEELWNALRQASAEEFVKNLPQQLDTIVGERGTQLSGGERQRLSLARALMRSPALLVLDEPTSALDDENEAVIHEALHSLKQNTTILLIAHRRTTLDIADHVIHLKQGECVSHVSTP